MPTKKAAKAKKPDPVLVVGPMVEQNNGTRVKIGLKPAKKASYTAYQNIRVTLGDDVYDYSEAWSLKSKGTQYDTFWVPPDRRDETYRSVAEMWLEKGGVDKKYKAGKKGADPWGTAKGLKQRRKPPTGATMVHRTTTLTWNAQGKLTSREQRNEGHDLT